MKKLLLLILFIAPVVLAAQADSTKTTADTAVKDSAVTPELVEKIPEYPGGQEAMVKFISKKLNYPKKARKNGVEGRVMVQFVIEPDGTTSNHTIVKDIGYGCGEEVIKVIKKMPKWKPSMQKGKAVRVRISLPVNFKLPAEED